MNPPNQSTHRENSTAHVGTDLDPIGTRAMLPVLMKDRQVPKELTPA